METNPKIVLPNATKEQILLVKKNGDVLALGMDGVMHQLHPALIEALGKGTIAPGIWSVALQLKISSEVGVLLPAGIISS